MPLYYIKKITLAWVLLKVLVVGKDRVIQAAGVLQVHGPRLTSLNYNKGMILVERQS